MRFLLTQCSVEVSATAFLSDWDVSQHPEHGSGPDLSDHILGHPPLLSSDSCICFMHSPLRWIGRLVKGG